MFVSSAAAGCIGYCIRSNPSLVPDTSRGLQGCGDAVRVAGEGTEWDLMAAPSSGPGGACWVHRPCGGMV